MLPINGISLIIVRLVGKHSSEYTQNNRRTVVYTVIKNTLYQLHTLCLLSLCMTSEQMEPLIDKLNRQEQYQKSLNQHTIPA